MASQRAAAEARNAPVAPLGQAVAALDAALADAGFDGAGGLARQVVDAGIAERQLTYSSSISATVLVQELAGAVSACGCVATSGKLHSLTLSASDASSRSLQALWALATDRLAGRLLADACELLGVPGPAKVLSLPANAKLFILASLAPSNLAATECSCRELRALASDDTLWAPLFSHEFGNPSDSDKRTAERKGWKAAFAERVQASKRAKLMKQRQEQQRSMHVHRPQAPRGGRRDPFGSGGFMDDDLTPGGGGGGIPPRGGRGGNPFFGGGGGII